MFKRRGWKVTAAAVVGTAGFLVAPAAAFADKTIAAGASGSTCTAYKAVIPTNLSWRTCAHATASLIYFTTWIINTGSGGVFVDNVQRDGHLVGSIEGYACAGIDNYYAPANSTTHTASTECDFNRGGAKTIFATGVVREGSYSGKADSPKLILK